MARLLGGLLPTTKQWDKAAGFDPANPVAQPVGGPDAAVNRRKEGPRSVTDLGDLSSTFKVIDMAGNGTELTRNLAGDRDKDKEVPWREAPDDALVILRGQRYQMQKPLQFNDLAKQQTDPQVQFYKAQSPFTGFRAVIEPR